MENGEYVGEINDKEIVLELLKFSTITLQFLTKDIQKIIILTKKLLNFLVWQRHGMFMMYVTEKQY